MPAQSTYTPIATYTGTNGVASVNFTSIPATYTDLVLVMTVMRSSSYAGTGIWLRLNNDSSALYSQTDLLGNGTSATSARSTGNTIWSGAQTLANDIPMTQVYNIMNYATSSYFKSAAMRIANDNNGSGYTLTSSCLYRSNTAISQVNVIIPGSGTLAYYSYTLYGITAA